jgi:AcrR family transcriptional regulator
MSRLSPPRPQVQFCRLVLDGLDIQSYDSFIRMSETADTKTRILDTAERLFGQKGFEATSLRDITAEAQVNLAAVNYHFQSKDSLMDAVIARRVEPVNQRRCEMLDAAGPSPTVEQVLTAFLEPVFDVQLEYAAPLVGRILSNPNLFLDRVYKRHFQAISERFRAAMIQALPGVPVADVLWGQLFTAGAMTQLMALGQVLPAITGGVCDMSDRAAVVARAVRFLAAGFRAGASGSEANDDRLAKELKCAG